MLSAFNHSLIGFVDAAYTYFKNHNVHNHVSLVTAQYAFACGFAYFDKTIKSSEQLLEA